MTNTMRSRSVLMIIFFAAAVAVAMVLFSVNTRPTGPVSETEPTLEEHAGPTQPTRVQNKAAEVLLSTIEPPASLELEAQDGPALMQSRCTQCHMLTWLKQVKKTRSDWAITLEKMESLNVSLTGTEETVLLDYLAIPDEP
jgi:hypothetical protein